MSAIEVKLDALRNKMNNQERRSHSAKEVGIVERAVQKQTVQGITHKGPYQVEEAQSIKENRG